MKKHLIILLGRSGSGKTTTLESLINIYGFNHIPQWTTRPKRDHEIDGEHYHFVTKYNSPKIGDLLTHYSTKTVYGVWHYGFSRQQFENNPNKINILVTDFKSAMNLKVDLFQDYTVHIIYLNPPVEDIQKRLVLRGDNPKEVQRRLLASLMEYQYAHRFCDLEVTSASHKNVLSSIIHYLNKEGVL